MGLLDVALELEPEEPAPQPARPPQPVDQHLEDPLLDGLARQVALREALRLLAQRTRAMAVRDRVVAQVQGPPPQRRALAPALGRPAQALYHDLLAGELILERGGGELGRQ
jgi:hypothetical protein